MKHFLLMLLCYVRVYSDAALYWLGDVNVIFSVAMCYACEEIGARTAAPLP